MRHFSKTITLRDWESRVGVVAPPYTDSDSGKEVSRKEIEEAFLNLSATGYEVRRKRVSPHKLPSGRQLPQFATVEHIKRGYVSLTGGVMLHWTAFHEWYEIHI